jgi:uncharacterized protein YcbK (DUF882 family)
MNLRYFNLSEFDSPDLEGSGEEMKGSTLQMLDRARAVAGIPFKINSGFRTAAHNRKVGGVPSSSHTKGYAVDIAAPTSYERFAIVEALLKAGFTRIGVGKTFVHADNDPTKPQGTIWTY